MRKLFLLLLFALWFGIHNAYSQETLQGEGERQQVLPEAGDLGLGFDAVPFLEYFGNIFNATQSNSVAAAFPANTQQVFLKYFLRDNLAIRSRLRLEHDRITDMNRVILDNQPIPDTDVQVTDEWVNTSSFVRAGAGMEFRRGSGRVVGVYGMEASFLYGQSTVSYEYGNPITEGNTVPSSTFGMINGGRFERITDQKSNRELGAGLNGFAGVEYYLGSKISLGAEFTLGVDFMRAFREEDTFEFWDNVSESVQTRSTVFEGGNQFLLQTGNYGGSINLMFYF